MNEPLHLLVIEDDPADFKLLERHIRHQGLEAIIRCVDSKAQLNLALEESWDLVLADYSLPDMDFSTSIACIHDRLPGTPVLLLSGSVSEEVAVDLLRLGLTDFILKDHLARLVPAIHRALDEAAERRARQQAEQTLRESQALALRNQEQARLAALNLMEDAMAARARAESACAALLESEEKYRLLTENSLDWIFWQSLEGQNKYVSPACLEISGHRPEEFFADPDLMSRLIHPEDRELFLSHRLNEEQGRSCSYVRFRIVRPDGEPRWIDHRCQLMFDKQDVCLGRHGSNRDISEELRLHAEQDSLRNQLHHAQKMESVGRLAGGVAHDFNNKLNIIMGYIELALLDPIVGGQLRLDLKEVLTAAKQSSNLTRQLLAFARRQTVVPQRLDLSDTIGSMLKMLRRLIGEDVTLNWIPAPQGTPVRIDPGQVDQILANLAVNARDAINGVGRLTIETSNISIDPDYCLHHPDATPGDYVMLSVSDNGCGMDDALQQEIFEPFFTTKAVGEGTGLGLATVYGIVKQNNGFITVASEPGQGTTFGIYIPRHAGEEEVQQSVETDSIPKGNETVLLVEDEKGLLLLAKNMLTQLGYQVLSAEDPGEALALVATYPGTIDLLLSDVVMPEMNGRELADKLAVLHPETIPLFMSGYTADVIAHHGVMDEGVQFLQKPFSIAILANKIRQLLDKTNTDGK